jgi:tRNA threonylcarbamoyladenosine biosynthesis protein TsaB
VENKYILCIETATEVCSVALSKSGRCIAEKSITEANVHGSILTVFIEDILKEEQLKISDLSAIAYSAGPGSYTGLRIGLSVAKGLCYGAGLPLIEVSTLQHLCSENMNDGEYYFPMIDARRMEVYGALLDSKNQFVIEPFACILTEFDWESLLNNKQVCFIGNGMPKALPILEKFPNIRFDQRVLSAATMSGIAYQKFLKHNWSDLAYSVPFYLKEVNVTEAKKKSL